MPEDCHALISKVTESGRRVPQDVRHLIADFVNGSPAFAMIPQEAQQIKDIKTMWPAVQRWELSDCADFFEYRTVHRITIYFKTDIASMQHLISNKAGVSLNEEEPDSENDQDHMYSKRVSRVDPSLLDEVRAGVFWNLRSMYGYAETSWGEEE
jgi:hypothetical protein